MVTTNETYLAVNAQLPDGWMASLITEGPYNGVEIHLMGTGDMASDWRKVIAAPNLEQATELAVAFANSTAPETYAESAGL